MPSLFNTLYFLHCMGPIKDKEPLNNNKGYTLKSQLFLSPSTFRYQKVWTTLCIKDKIPGPNMPFIQRLLYMEKLSDASCTPRYQDHCSTVFLLGMRTRIFCLAQCVSATEAARARALLTARARSQKSALRVRRKCTFLSVTNLHSTNVTNFIPQA